MPQFIHFSDEARAQLRAIERNTALLILKGIDGLWRTGAGDVRRLHGFDPPRFRLRVGDWRVVFRWMHGGAIQVLRVAHRSEVYR